MNLRSKCVLSGRRDVSNHPWNPPNRPMTSLNAFLMLFIRFVHCERKLSSILADGLSVVGRTQTDAAMWTILWHIFYELVLLSVKPKNRSNCVQEKNIEENHFSSWILELLNNHLQNRDLRNLNNSRKKEADERQPTNLDHRILGFGPVRVTLVRCAHDVLAIDEGEVVGLETILSPYALSP